MNKKQQETTLTRVTKERLEDFNKLCDIKGIKNRREQIDQALDYFYKLKLLPEECEDISKKLQDQTSRYISFFKVAEKNLYNRFDSFLNEVGKENTTEGHNSIKDELRNVSALLNMIYESIRLGYLLHLRTIELVSEDNEIFDAIQKEFKEQLAKLESRMQ